MYSLHTIGALIKEKATGPLVQKSKRHHFPDSEEAPFSSAPQTGKNAQPLLTFEKTLPTRLLAQKSKRNHSPNLESQTPNRITFSEIEEIMLSKSQESDSQQDCFLKNRRGTVLRISRARSSIGLLVRKSKRHRSPNFET
ncbi:hypothetical protein ACFX2J_034636 [Malus domestica]